MAVTTAKSFHVHQRRELLDVTAGTTTATHQSPSGTTSSTTSFVRLRRETSEQTVAVAESIRQATRNTESSATDLTHQLKVFTDGAIKATHGTVRVLNEAKVDCGWYSRRTMWSHLAQAAHKAYEYVDDVDDLYYYGLKRDQVERIKFEIYRMWQFCSAGRVH